MKRHIPNVITSLNLIAGSVGCFIVIRGDYKHAIYFVLLAAFFDFFDGLAARGLKVQSPVGKELDSLADLVSFGVLPAFYLVMAMDSTYPPSYFLKFFSLIVVVFSAIRLAKFNVDTRQSEQFIGLPTPANAIFITSLVLLPSNIFLDYWVLMIIALSTSLLLVSELPLIALKFKTYRWKSNELRFTLIITSIVLLGFLRLSAIPFIIPCYIILSIVGNFTKKNHV
ncbi:MAG: CDP-diacylglycerol--serine O-phosphatidyltransferase [Marinoscillum sp.]|jgi:CDP-diacylglycerol--serine O-phosphatidyltransferase